VHTTDDLAFVRHVEETINTDELQRFKQYVVAIAEYDVHVCELIELSTACGVRPWDLLSQH
jgi:hypothetical protein